MPSPRDLLEAAAVLGCTLILPWLIAANIVL